MDEAEQDCAAELTRDEGRPGLAVAISSVILLLSTCRADQVIASRSDGLAYLLGGIAGCVAIFWGIPYWITIRKASRAWKIGTFVGIAVLATLTELWAFGGANLRLEAGMKNQARQVQEMANGRRTRLEAASDADPLQKAMVELGNRNIADLQAYHAALIAAGAERISMLQGLQHNSAELQNCQRFDGFAAQARSNRAKLDTYVAEARTKLDAEVSNGTLTQGTVDDFLGGVSEGKPDFERTWELQAQYAAAVGEVCRTLMRNNWRLQGGQLAFTNDADMAATNAQLASIRKIGAEQQRMRSETLANMQKQSLR